MPLAEDGKKPKKVEHVKEGIEVSQFTRVIFESPATVQPFISKFIEKGTKNAHNRPVFARPEVDKVVRKIRNPLVQAEKKVKDADHKEAVQALENEFAAMPHLSGNKKGPTTSGGSHRPLRLLRRP